MQMAEQLLISGCLDEAQLRSMDMVEARVNIGITLLSHSGIQAYLITVGQGMCYYHVLDMHEKCLICGEGEDSMSHPDYADWVSG